ncbi:hypothetical protein D3C84_269850 [compost metagenome]
MGHRIEQVTLLVEQVFDVAGHGVEDMGQMADVGTGGNLGALAQMPLAEAFGGMFQAFQVTPVRTQPDQQAGQQRRADQHIDAPVQQTDVHRVGRDDQLHRQLSVQWRHRQGAPAPVPHAHDHLAALQALALMGGKTAVVDPRHRDLQRPELLIHLSGERRPLFGRHTLELLDDEVLHPSGMVEVVTGKTLVKNLDDQVRDQIDRRTEGDDGDQVQANQDAQHGFSIPTRNG